MFAKNWPGYILAALVQVFQFMSVYPKVVESLYHPESLELIEFLWKHHDTPKLNQSAGIHVGVLGQLRSVEVSDIPGVRLVPTYPNISWIHQLVSAGFRYPEYEPNVEHFLEVLEPFFSITVEEAGSSMFQAHGFGPFQATI